MPAGFFAPSQLVNRAPPSLIARCGECGLFKHCQSPKMPHSGEGALRILICGEAPGKSEDQENRQFCGKTGQYLERVLRKFQIDMRRDCWLTNSLICRPQNNRTPTNEEIDFCRPNLLRTLRELEPEIIIPLGAAALRSLIGHLWKPDPGPIGQWVGWNIPDQQLNAWISPTWHPSYVVRSLDQERPDPVPGIFFERQLCGAVSNLGRPWPEGPPDYPGQVELIWEPERAAGVIRKMIERGGPVAFDYECNGLKPDADWFQIRCCSVCWRGRKTIAFPWLGEAIQAMREFAVSPLPKIAANMKYEHRVTRQVLGVDVRNWWHDTMVAAHVEDNRSGQSGLKFQAYVLLGQPVYNAHVEPFLEGEANQPNRIHLVDLSDLMSYCGTDSLLEYHVAMKQRKVMGLDTET